MGATGRARAVHPIAGSVSHSRELLERLARILVHTGHSPRQLAREFRAICGSLKEPKQRWDPNLRTYFADLPHVIAHWHADPQYLDSRGDPRALPLRGRGPSLCALIERVLPGKDPVAVAKSLTQHQAVRTVKGRYIPSGRSFTYPRASGRVHGLNALLGMLRTVERNVSGARNRVILERAALNPSFPVSELPAFHRRVRTLAEEVLWNVDGDMRRRENKDLQGPRVRLGVGIFAFEEPIPRSREQDRKRPLRARTAARPTKRRRP
jgi:hypothetical protein